MFKNGRYFLFSSRGPRFWVFSLIILFFYYVFGNPFKEGTSTTLNYYAEEVLSFLFFAAILLPIVLAILYYLIVFIVYFLRKSKPATEVMELDFETKAEHNLAEDSEEDDKG